MCVSPKTASMLVPFCGFSHRVFPEQTFAGSHFSSVSESVGLMMKQLASFRLSAYKLRVEVDRHQGVLWEN
jgi:hypothetical protein